MNKSEPLSLNEIIKRSTTQKEEPTWREQLKMIQSAKTQQASLSAANNSIPAVRKPFTNMRRIYAPSQIQAGAKRMSRKMKRSRTQKARGKMSRGKMSRRSC